MRAIAWMLGLATLVASGAYVVVSLARWEWNRALFFGLVFVATEVIVAVAVVLSRLDRLERRVGRADAAAPPDRIARRALATTRDDHARFAWLRVDPVDVVGRTNVFVTLLVGGGALLSGGAWVLDHLARRSVDPVREDRLARDLDRIAYRPGLLVDEVSALARPALDQDDPRVTAFLGPDR